MSFTTVVPEAVNIAASDITSLHQKIDEAISKAQVWITDIETAAQDEISYAIAGLFGSHGAQFQFLTAQAAAFHSQFAKVLTSGSAAYSMSDSSNSSSLVSAAGKDVTIIMGGTAIPYPPPSYVSALFNNFASSYFPGFTSENIIALFTPEQFFPFTGIHTETLNSSVSQGVTLLNNAIMTQVGEGNNVTVVGYSQSSIIASLEMRALQSMTNSPSASRLNFVLLGNPMNPNGGLEERFPGLNIGAIGLRFDGYTPTNTIYPTHIYSEEYDLFVDAPQYPIDIFSDLNAVLGTFYAHGQYMLISPTQVSNAISLPINPAYGTNISYSIIPTSNLPLLEPLLKIPIIGKPLVDLIQPDLTYLVNWGYGNPAYGYSTGFANVPTKAGILPPLSDTLELVGDLATGTQQGIASFAHAIEELVVPHG